MNFAYASQRKNTIGWWLNDKGVYDSLGRAVFLVYCQKAGLPLMFTISTGYSSKSKLLHRDIFHCCNVAYFAIKGNGSWHFNISLQLWLPAFWCSRTTVFSCRRTQGRHQLSWIYVGTVWGVQYWTWWTCKGRLDIIQVPLYYWILTYMFELSLWLLSFYKHTQEQLLSDFTLV